MLEAGDLALILQTDLSLSSTPLNLSALVSLTPFLARMDNVFIDCVSLSL